MSHAAHAAASRQADYFYFHMAMACVAVAFLGFAPTYWAPMVKGTFRAAPIFHLHGLLFFSWTLYFAFQTWLAASGQVARHRTVGLIGVSLATAMVIFGFLVTIAATRRDIAMGQAKGGLAFMIVSLSEVLFFAGIIILALRNIRRPEWHKRLMLLATIILLPAAIARWFVTFLAPAGASGPPPVGIAIGPILVCSLLLVIAMLHDRRIRGRPHIVYVAGTAAFIALGVARIPISATRPGISSPSG